MQSRYEALLLTVPEITEDEVKSLESHIDRLVKESQGKILSFERWGKYKLAYPIRGNDYGVYFLTRFDSLGTAVQEIRTLFAVKLHDLVMRDMFIQLDPNASLVYQRPQSLEDAPGRDVAAFLKENKMESLITAADTAEGFEFGEDEE